MSDYESVVEQLVAQGVPRDRAERYAREKFPTPPADIERKANVLEKEEQAIIMKIARAIGCTVRSTSQARASKVSPGIPDLWISHRARCFAGWFEVKRQAGGRTSSEQIDFGEECRAAGIAYGLGDRFQFAAWLTDHGFTPPPVPE